MHYSPPCSASTVLATIPASSSRTVPSPRTLKPPIMGGYPESDRLARWRLTGGSALCAVMLNERVGQQLVRTARPCSPPLSNVFASSESVLLGSRSRQRRVHNRERLPLAIPSSRSIQRDEITKVASTLSESPTPRTVIGMSRDPVTSPVIWPVPVSYVISSRFFPSTGDRSHRSSPDRAS